MPAVLQASLDISMMSASWRTVTTGERSQAAQMPANYYLLPFDFGDDLYAVGFRLSDEALAQQVNDTLQALIADGTAYEIAEKWLAAEKIIIP